MARPPDLERRQELLDALAEEFAVSGIGDRSLRQVAEAVGTNHRMLLHHFRSRDELLLAIVQKVEHRQRAVLANIPGEPAEAFAAMWSDVRRLELRAFERLFFECYARGAQGEKPFDRMVPGAVHDWLAAVDAAAGIQPEPALTRLGLAVVRGLLLDLAATDDDAEVNAAASAFTELMARAGAPPI